LRAVLEEEHAMSRRLSASLLATALALSPVPMIATSTPAAAQYGRNYDPYGNNYDPYGNGGYDNYGNYDRYNNNYGNPNPNYGNASISFDFFYDQLSPYGQWSYHPRWGDVWRPTRVASDFRPYFRGHWVNTEYGWTWNSEDPFGGIPYHYGRWVYDPYDGWLWVPGYTWAPAWVVWRGDAQNIGWFPMPPDDQFLSGVEVYRDDWDWNRGYFGYQDWYGPSIATGLLGAWTFVALDRFADRDYYRYAYDRPRVVNVMNNTTNITNYVTVNNRIVNRSVDVARVERASGRRIQQVEARNVIRTPIETVDRGRQLATREREFL